jgi:hypothetical protein
MPGVTDGATDSDRPERRVQEKTAESVLANEGRPLRRPNATGLVTTYEVNSLTKAGRQGGHAPQEESLG